MEPKATFTADQRTSLFRARFDPESAESLEELVPIIYDELREIAHRQLSGWPNDTLNTTALVHEAYMRLVGASQVMKRGKSYFYGSAARAMRQVLVDFARRRNAAKRGGGEIHLSLDDDTMAVEVFATDLLDLNAALIELAQLSERQAKVVECRFFGGMTVDETATCIDVSVRTVKSEWALARAFLYRRLGEQE